MTRNQVREVFSLAREASLQEVPTLDFYAVHERSTAYRFAMHLQPYFSDWNVDCEYDRYGEVQKELQRIRECREGGKTYRILPDIVVHHRGQNGPDHNLLVIELKKDAPRDECDFAKLCGLTDPNGPFRYQYGAYHQYQSRGI